MMHTLHTDMEFGLFGLKFFCEYYTHLTHLPHICVSELGHHYSGNGLLSIQRQAITWSDAGLLSIELLGTNFSEIWIGILSFSFKKMHLKMLSAKMAASLSRERWAKFVWNVVLVSACSWWYDQAVFQIKFPHQSCLSTNVHPEMWNIYLNDYNQNGMLPFICEYTMCGLSTP